jgi:hypothetical protein
MSKKTKFKNRFRNQTEIGKMFGLSDIKIGQLLSEHGLKNGEIATQKALDDGYASYTPLQDGTPFYMWDHQKIRVLSQDAQLLAREERAINTVKDIIREATRLVNGDSRADEKVGYLIYEYRYDGIPSSVRNLIRWKPEFDLGLEQCKDGINKYLLEFISQRSNVELEEITQMIQRYYPQYLEKIKTYTVFK